jgi:hypothetical protein
MVLRARWYNRSVSARLPGEAVNDVVRYASSGETDHYDDIAFRYFQACRTEEIIGFETLAGHARAERRSANLRLPFAVRRLVAQEIDLVHRPIEVPSGEFHFIVENGLTQARGPDHLTWVIPTSTPTPMFERLAEDRDVRPAISADAGDEAYSFWLSVPALVQAGSFPRMQEIRDRLRRGTRPGELRVFVSHRWQHRGHPDHDGRQARTVAWRLFGTLCHAVRVAARRGLHTPRKIAGGIAVGPAGSPLAESVIVTVMRTQLVDDDLARAAAEVSSVAGYVDDLGAAQARSDLGLAELRRLLAELPMLRALLARIVVWYDYSCMPQAPRTEDETELFRRTMSRLMSIQASSRTLILLDDTRDYLGRAWCHYEASIATRISDAGLDVLSFDEEPLPGRESEPHDLIRLVLDRQEVVWRAVLDTEVFGLQSAEGCLRRLGLSMTDPNDLPYLYNALRVMGAPVNTRTGPGSLVTGAVPLPTVEAGASVLILLDKAELPDTSWDVLGSVDLTDCLRPPGPPRARVPSYQKLPDHTHGRTLTCHVAILASCEGEATVLCSRLLDMLPSLAAPLRAQVVSMSWLSIDAVPVGHRPDGALRVQPITADLWALVGRNLTRSPDAVAMLTQVLSDANTPAVAIELLSRTDNISALPTGLAWKSYLVRNDFDPMAHPEGLLQQHFATHLLQSNKPIRG